MFSINVEGFIGMWLISPRPDHGVAGAGVIREKVRFVGNKPVLRGSNNPSQNKNNTPPSVTHSHDKKNPLGLGLQAWTLKEINPTAQDR